MYLVQNFLKCGIDDVPVTNARAGIVAFTYGSSSFATRKNTNMIKYVRVRVRILLVQLVSQALSSSTRLFRALILLISFSSC